MICNRHFVGEYFTTPSREHLIKDSKVEPVDYREVDASCSFEVNPQKAVRVYKAINSRTTTVQAASLHGEFRRPLSSIKHLNDIHTDADAEDEVISVRIPSPPAALETPEQENLVEKEEVLSEFVQQDRENLLQNEVARLRLMLHQVQNQLSDLKSKTVASNSTPTGSSEENPDVSSFLSSLDLSNPIRKTLIELQLRPDNCKKPYSDEEWTLAMKLHYWSASSYERMRRSGIQLPHPRSVEKRIANYDITPGFIDQQFQDLTDLLSKCPPAAKCAIAKFDEMATKEFEEYSSKYDLIEGFEDLGPLGRTEKRANHLFLFTLNGLHPLHRWRIIGGFFFPHNSVSGKDIVSFLRILIEKGEKAGADIRMTVCDQGSPNLKAYRLLNVTPQKPSFLFRDKKIIAIHDFPHEIKNFVTALRKHGIVYMNGKKLCFSDMKSVWEADRKCPLSCNLAHIKEVHMFPNSFQKMSVGRAFQLVGGRMGHAMLEAFFKELVISSTLQESASCILDINKLTDAANSLLIYDKNPLKCALSPEHPEPIQVLEDFLSWAPTLKVYDAKTKKMKRLPCFEGLEMTIRGILELYKEVTFPLCTQLCSQDSLETLFSRIRGRGGFNPNPTTRMTRLILRHMLAMKHDNIAVSMRGNISVEEEKSPQALSELDIATFKEHLENSDESEVAATRAVAFMEAGRQFPENVTVAEEMNEDDDSGTEIDTDIDGTDDEDGDGDNRVGVDGNVTVHDDSSSAKSTKNVGTHLATKVKELLRSTEADMPFETYSGTYEGSSLTYFAGYAAHITTKKWQCDRCYDELLKPPEAIGDRNDTYIESREYETKTNYKVTLLKKPSEKFREIVTANLLTFERCITAERHNRGILDLLLKNAIRDTKRLFPEWYSESDPCREHRILAVKALFTAKLHRVCSIDNSNAIVDKKTKSVENAAKKQARANKRTAKSEVGYKQPRKLRNLMHE